MPFSKHIEILLAQFPHAGPYPPFENECETQLMLHAEPYIKDKILDWIKGFKLDTAHKCAVDSDRYREEGNRLFRANKKLNAIEASQCYTNAIFAAPDGSKSLSLAHANRSAAIAEFGYYKEAYEDCQCAIDYGYPDENLQKIIVRQAYCASKLQDCEKLNACLEKLRKMTLSEPFAKQKTEFEEDLVKLKEKGQLEKTPTFRGNYMVQNVLTHPQNGRYMTASKDIAKGEVILIEEVFSLHPLTGTKICSYCAAQNIIPFPCNICSRVFYCSLKCRQAHEMVHRFECYAHRSGLLGAIDILHLPMNTLLNGLPSIIPMLQDCTTPTTIWKKIEDIAKSGDKGYAEVLSLITNIEFMDPSEIRRYSLAASVVEYYLKEFTAFFTLFKGCACGTFEWSVVVSALILRHTAQIVSNVHSCFTIICLDVKNFHALSSDWARPQHLKKGRLHAFSEIDLTYAGFFPYFSMCNHSCESPLRLKLDGSYVTATARHSIKEGAEIYHDYLVDYRLYPKSVRKERLKPIFRFECKCKYCSPDNDDSEVLKFHKYRCQSSKCEAIFTPPIANIRWYADREKLTSFLTCPVCKAETNLDWYWDFDSIQQSPSHITKVLQLMNVSKRILVGCSELRRRMASSAVKLFFSCWMLGVPLSRGEFKEIGEILNYCLDQIEQQIDVESVFYVTHSTFALDLMAQGHCFNFDCRKIRESFKMLPRELKIVFDNYIDDFFGDKFKDDKLC